ncbi:HNH endonuclease [Pseudomonas yamanorum]|uniref:HNH endonuclease n=1 Tax=Pseudomonas yamanorum TaxID=515393 RepID=A0ABU1CQ89_9PSED|nr:HNH endonuclease [Pseudomonas yamanorum]MDR0189434.1 HNH endonuclease [Pseudomonas yamanorum]
MAGKRRNERERVRDAWQADLDEVLRQGFNSTIFEIIEEDGEDNKLCWCCASGGHQEVAHIVPKSKGGSRDALNLFLLCAECHLCSPDFDDRKFFVKYINGNAGKGFDAAVQKMIEVGKNLSTQIDLYLPGISHEEVEKLINAAGRDGFEKTTTHGAHLSLSTKLAVMESIEEHALSKFNKPAP